MRGLDRRYAQVPVFFYLRFFGNEPDDGGKREEKKQKKKHWDRLVTEHDRWNFQCCDGPQTAAGGPIDPYNPVKTVKPGTIR